MKNLIYLAIIAITSFLSCSADNVNSNHITLNPVFNHTLVPLEVTTDIVLRPSTRAIFEGTPDDQIGIFVTSIEGILGKPYDGLSTCDNILTTYTGGNWVLTTNVYLSRNLGKAYCYYPYKTVNTDGRRIPIEHKTQTDYLWGFSKGMVNNSNNKADLTLMHTLSLLQFRFKKDVGYNGDCKVEAIGIGNKSGLTGNNCVLFSGGWQNLENGEITLDKTKTEGAELRNEENGVLPAPVTSVFPADETLYAKLMIIPPEDVPHNLGDLLINFQIDGKKYEFQVPAMQRYLKGTKYTYDVTVSPTKMLFSKATITNWTNGQSSSITL